ncbi:hypothetical protein PAMC26510_06965 [Caballeronia sordidicola]|uniref:Uncharacterized protein n=1 Tax=Caballeronia sordidicola TaxID=196367 RepID=A0A242N5D2_CABSO|nr:hypothetical protein PAMC26510_06965 [Caballeronia sordidicola]
MCLCAFAHGMPRGADAHRVQHIHVVVSGFIGRRVVARPFV